MARPRPNEAERFWRRVERRADGCWVWHGARARRGGELRRGKFKGSDGTTYVAVRFAWFLVRGEHPPRLDPLMSICGRDNCVRPDHHRVMPAAEFAATRIPRRSHCPRGHAMAGANIAIDGGTRHCAACRRDRRRALTKSFHLAPRRARPDRETLAALLARETFTAVARRYGVSDVTVRKWSMSQGIQLPRRVTNIGRERSVIPSADELAPRVRLPVTRGECVDAARPCPFEQCRYHLQQATMRIGRGRSGRPRHRAPNGETCSLDVADRGGVTLETVAEVLGLTRERIRQIEAKASDKLRARVAHGDRLARELAEHIADGGSDLGEGSQLGAAIKSDEGGGQGGEKEVFGTVTMHARAPFLPVSHGEAIDAIARRAGVLDGPSPSDEEMARLAVRVLEDPTKDDDGWCARVWDAYVRSSANHGLVADDQIMRSDGTSSARPDKSKSPNGWQSMNYGSGGSRAKEEEPMRGESIDKETLEAIASLTSELGRPPFASEIGNRMQISTGAAQQRLTKLRKIGKVPRRQLNAPRPKIAMERARIKTVPPPRQPHPKAGLTPAGMADLAGHGSQVFACGPVFGDAPQPSPQPLAASPIQNILEGLRAERAARAREMEALDRAIASLTNGGAAA